MAGPSHAPDPPPPPPLPPPCTPPLHQNQVTGRFSNLIHRFTFKPRGMKADLHHLFLRYKKVMASHLLHLQKKFDLMRFYIIYTVKFKKEVNGETIEIIRHFYGGMQLHQMRNFDETYQTSHRNIEKKIDTFIHMGSGKQYLFI